MPFLAAILNIKTINKLTLKTDSLHTNQILSPPKDKSDVQKSKRVSLFTSAPYKSNRLAVRHSGSITIEAAMVLPIFIFCICYIMCFTNVVKISGELGNVLYESSKELSQYAYVYDKAVDKGNVEKELGDIVSYGMGNAYVGSKLSKSFDKGYLKKNGINGISGINLYLSSYMDNDIIDVIAVYKAAVNCNFFKLPDIPIVLRYRVRAWTGYKQDVDLEDNNSEDMVYITENGTVYHRTTACTHLRLSIKSVNKSDVKALRNDSGGKYYSCELCGGDSNVVYITDTGNRYHKSKECRGLKRLIIKIPLSQINGRAPCSRCGG